MYLPDLCGSIDVHGIIKKKTTQVVCLLYAGDFYPSVTFNNQQGHIDYIMPAVRKLLHKRHFRNGGLDEQVSPDNLRQRNDPDGSAYRTYQQLNHSRDQGSLNICIRACHEVAPS